MDVIDKNLSNTGVCLSRAAVSCQKYPSEGFRLFRKNGTGTGSHRPRSVPVPFFVIRGLPFRGFFFYVSYVAAPRSIRFLARPRGGFPRPDLPGRHDHPDRPYGSSSSVFLV